MSLSGMVESPRIQAKPDTPPSPGYPLGAGEGGDGGESSGDSTPTFVLPRRGGGESFGVGFKPTTDEPTALEPVVVHEAGRVEGAPVLLFFPMK